MLYFGVDVGKCPSGSSKLIYDYEYGEVLCAVCGSIVTQNIASGRNGVLLMLLRGRSVLALGLLRTFSSMIRSFN